MLQKSDRGWGRNPAALGELEDSGFLRRRSQGSRCAEGLGPELRCNLGSYRLCPRSFLRPVGLGRLVTLFSGSYRAGELPRVAVSYSCRLDRTRKRGDESSVNSEVTLPFGL